MSAAEVASDQQSEKIVAAELEQLAALPEWLRAALDGERIANMLRARVPEFASGALKLRGCKIKRLLLKDDDGRWSGTYQLTVEAPESGQKRTVALRGTLTAPRLRHANGAQAAEAAFATDGWRCALPELGLELELEPPDIALPALPTLTDPEQARALLERSIRERGPAYADMRIAACRPEVLVYKPGSRGIIRYHLEYLAELADHGWPATVIAKTYRKDSKAKNAYDGMLALWNSALAAGDSVTIAEPLAYVSDLKLMVQSPVAEELTLEDLLKAALREGGDRMEELRGYMRKAARGLAAVHLSGAQHGDLVSLEGRFPEISGLIERLAVPVPELGEAATPLLRRLEAYAAAHPAGAPVPTHGTFNPEQVLIHQGRIGFIDFDDFCMAEPAMDVGLFCSAIRDTGMNAGDEAFFASRPARLERLAQLDTICEEFVDEYAAHAPIARERVVLWQALDFLRNCLHYWIKVKPAEPDTPMLVLERLLRRMEQPALTIERAPVLVASPVAISFAGVALLIAALGAPPPAVLVLLAGLACASLLAGRGAWRQVFAQIDVYPLRQRLIAAGALGFGLSALAAALGLAEVEPLALVDFAALPAHILLAALFAIAVFMVAGATGGALGMALRSRRAAAALALAGGLAAGAAFLSIDLAIDTSTSAFEALALGDLGAAAAGSFAIALVLARLLVATPAEASAQSARV